MTEYDAGYLRALRDVQISVRQMADDLGSTSEGKVEILGVSFLEGMIRTNGELDGEHNGQDAPDPRSGSF